MNAIVVASGLATRSLGSSDGARKTWALITYLLVSSTKLGPKTIEAVPNGWTMHHPTAAPAGWHCELVAWGLLAHTPSTLALLAVIGALGMRIKKYTGVPGACAVYFGRAASWYSHSTAPVFAS